MTTGLPRGGRTLAVSIMGGAALLAACGAAPRSDIRLWSEHYEFRVMGDPSPPHAREPIIYTVTVLDKDSRQLIENGEGRIFASSIDKVNKYDSFVPGREAGTYTARLQYTTAGDWGVAVQFRTDSTKPLERVDWVQTVRAERPINERPAH
jgi:hypothetical protein